MPRVPHVLAVVPAFKRVDVLRRLFESLRLAEAEGLRGVVLVDSANDPATAALAKQTPLVVEYLPQAQPSGTGVAHARGLEAALRRSEVTHCWLLDDDVVVRAGTLAGLIAGLDGSGGGMAVPLIENAQGHVAWFPGVKDSRAWHMIRREGLRPEDYLRECGPGLQSISWAPWTCLLVTRRAVEELGRPREDFGFMGEDLEYSLRISHGLGGVLVPQAVAAHLPPVARTGSVAYLIERQHLQNFCYTLLRLPHGRREWRRFPGGFWRFLQKFGWRPRTLWDGWLAFWRGGLAGHPAGHEGWDEFNRAWRLASSS